MSSSKGSWAWLAASGSVEGFSHQKSGLPNQDAVGFSPPAATGPPISLAVADGHGSAPHFRSDRGARFSVDSALAELLRFQEALGSDADLTAIKRRAEESLPKAILRTWLEAVGGNLEADPITEEQLAQVEQRGGVKARREVEASPIKAYGATLLAVLVTETYILYIQLGDGDILCVSASGESTRPLPKDDRLLGNETWSLCLPNAWRDFRVRLTPRCEASPSMILVSTDGYSNSFQTEDDFLKVGPDILRGVRERGLGTVESQLPAILENASRAGSSDDITLGILKCVGTGDWDDVTDRLESMESRQGRLEMAVASKADEVALAAAKLSQTEGQAHLEGKITKLDEAVGSLVRLSSTPRSGDPQPIYGQKENEDRIAAVSSRLGRAVIISVVVAAAAFVMATAAFIHRALP
jgi:hypothetical protein